MMLQVRTTVTLDPDVEALVKRLMQEDGISFKTALNQALRKALSPPGQIRFVQRTHSMGARPGVPYDKALSLASALEDQEIIRKLDLGK